jgi:hypothetical protein
MCSCRPEQTETCGGDGCHPIDPPIPQQWLCETPVLGDGCPEHIPNAGTQCDDLPIRCLYGPECTGLDLVCDEGYHDGQLALCP